MGEEVKMSDYDHHTAGGSVDGDGDDDRVLEWEAGLPNTDDLTSLSQSLISPELASAFSISPEPYRTLLDVNRASNNTFSGLNGSSGGGSNFKSDNSRDRDPMVVEEDETDRDGSGSDSRKLRKVDCAEEANSALRTEDSADDPSARALKRARLVWTPQLHKRFVDVVAHLGIKNAVPKTIMQWMNVEGLTRENVASHLQKYRLYLKRMQGQSTEGASPSDQLFASTPVPPSLHESNGNRHLPVPIPMMYGQQMMQMHGHTANSSGGPGMYHGFDSHPFNMNMNMNMMQQRDWSGNNYMSYQHHVPPNDK